MKKKIGILTFFWSDNAGTFLQAYSTMKAIQNKFPDWQVEIIDYKYRPYGFQLMRRHLYPPFLIGDYRRYKLFKKNQDQLFVKSVNSIITADYQAAGKFLEQNNYDLIIVGSDVVFQPVSPWMPSDQPPIYWLPAWLKCKKVACAASSNTWTYEQTSESMRKKLSDSINGFDLVGVRDQLTYNLVKTIGLKDLSRLELIPDPTFTYDIDDDEAINYMKKTGMDPSKPKIGINLSYSKLTDEIIRHYRSKGFEIVAMNYYPHMDYQPWVISPGEWAGLYKYFSLMITDRFHGTIFSLRNNIPVIGIDCSHQEFTVNGFSRIRHLLKEYDLEHNHFILKEVKNFDEFLQRADAAIKNHNPQRVEQKNMEMRNRYFQFVDRIVGIMNEKR